MRCSRPQAEVRIPQSLAAGRSRMKSGQRRGAIVWGINGPVTEGQETEGSRHVDSSPEKCSEEKVINNGSHPVR